MLDILVALPVLTPTIEQTFSSLHHKKKKYLRPTTRENWLTGLALPLIHNYILVDSDKK